MSDNSDKFVSYDIVIPGGIRKDQRLSFKEQLLYAEIRGLCKLEGYCWAGSPFLAKRMKVSTRTIRRWLKHLQDCGHIKIEMLAESKNTRKITLIEGRTEMSTSRTEMSSQVGHGCPHNNISEYKEKQPKKHLTSEEIKRRLHKVEADYQVEQKRKKRTASA